MERGDLMSFFVPSNWICGFVRLHNVHNTTTQTRNTNIFEFPMELDLEVYILGPYALID